MFNIQIYNTEIDNKRTNDIGKPRKIKHLSISNDNMLNDFANIKPLEFIENDYNDNSAFNNDDYIKTKLILCLLSKFEKYYSNYNEWRNIGFCLGTLANKNPSIEDKYLNKAKKILEDNKIVNLHQYSIQKNFKNTLTTEQSEVLNNSMINLVENMLLDEPSSTRKTKNCDRHNQAESR